MRNKLAAAILATVFATPAFSETAYAEFSIETDEDRELCKTLEGADAEGAMCTNTPLDRRCNEVIGSTDFYYVGPKKNEPDGPFDKEDCSTAIFDMFDF